MRFNLTLCGLLLFGGFASVSANAEQIAQSQGLDERVQIFDYSPKDVFVIHAKQGYSTLIQFEDDEVITDKGGLGMGDAKAWSLAVRTNNIFFKPVESLPDTNMLVVTNKRTYAFRLTTSGSYSTYIARFNYPETKKPVDYQGKQSPQKFLSIKTGVGENQSTVLIDSSINTYYMYRGDVELKPTNVWDDKLFTYIKFDHGGDLPAIFRVLPDGSEMLVNYHVKDDVVVLQETNNLYRLRFGKSVGDVSSQRENLPDFNKTGTSDKTLERTDK